uniref:Nuclear receptor domain-containing protein n=1 Tax=Caenorhabditis japonica TaxID=281687 RepID=A0A8R1HGN5_CAEJA
MIILPWVFNWFLWMVSGQPESGYGYQTGHISMNDSEVTILINSTFEIIEDFDSDNFTTIVTTTPTTSTTSKTPKIAPKSTIRMKKLRPQCQKYTEAEKYKILEGVGGRNQLFMADSVDEAAHNFVDAFSADSPPFPISLEDSAGSGPSTPECDSRCQMIKSALNREIAARRADQNSTHRSFFRIRASVFSDAPPIVPKSCSLGNFIPVGVCTDLGEPVDGGNLESLCSECHGLYMLGSNCFPKIFNAIKCNSQETGCIFDTFTDMEKNFVEEWDKLSTSVPRWNLTHDVFVLSLPPKKAAFNNLLALYF